MGLPKRGTFPPWQISDSWYHLHLLADTGKSQMVLADLLAQYK